MTSSNNGSLVRKHSGKWLRVATYKKYCLPPWASGLKPKAEGQTDSFQTPKIIIGSSDRAVVIFQKRKHAKTKVLRTEQIPLVNKLCLLLLLAAGPHMALLHLLYLMQVNNFLNKVTDETYRVSTGTEII